MRAGTGYSAMARNVDGVIRDADTMDLPAPEQMRMLIEAITLDNIGMRSPVYRGSGLSVVRLPTTRWR